ncbi:hypothetical protein HK101_011576, partial [Irineochytrium annulatum]
MSVSDTTSKNPSFESDRTSITLVSNTRPPSFELDASTPKASQNPWNRFIDGFKGLYNNTRKTGPATSTEDMYADLKPASLESLLAANSIIPAENTSDEAEPERFVTARVVADASGLSRVIGGGLGDEERALVQPVKFDGIDFDAYWAYFEEDLSYPEIMNNWGYSSAKMVCFAEAKIDAFYRRILSWEQSPRTNLMDMIHHLLDLHDANVPISSVPPIHEMSTIFSCTYKPIVSVGVCVRTDAVAAIQCPPFLDASKATKNEMRFWGVVANHPVLAELVRTSGRYSLLEKYYGPVLGTFMARRAMSYRVPRVAGPGWFAMGISAGFTSPLFSPGINMLATPMGVKAAKLTVKHLETGVSVWEEYDRFVNEGQVPGLRNVDILLYNIFRDPRLFMSCFPIYYANGIGALKRYVEQFQDAELNWANGSNEQVFKDWTAEIFPLICGPSDEPVSDAAVNEVEKICERYRVTLVRAFSEWTKYSRHLRCYDDNLMPLAGKLQRIESEFMSKRCGVCQHAQDYLGTKCVMCESEGEAMK